MKEKSDAKLQIEGRHDPAIIHRARVVVDSVTALVIYDALVGRYGTDFFGPYSDKNDDLDLVDQELDGGEWL